MFNPFKRKREPKHCDHCGGPCSDAVVCHYCGDAIDFFGRLVMKHDTCRNCKEVQFFHGNCHDTIGRLQPRCHGVYVGHTTGHTIDVHGSGKCTLCFLAREFWPKWHCSPGVVALNSVDIAKKRFANFAQETQSPSHFVN